MPAAAARSCITYNSTDLLFLDALSVDRGRKKKKKLSACRGEGSVVGLQLRVRFVPAALLAVLEIGQVM